MPPSDVRTALDLFQVDEAPSDVQTAIDQVGDVFLAGSQHTPTLVMSLVLRISLVLPTLLLILAGSLLERKVMPLI